MKLRIHQNRISKALATVANYHQWRRNTTARSINAIPYRPDYFGYKLHIDHNKNLVMNLVMYGVVHVAAIDDHSVLLLLEQQCWSRTTLRFICILYIYLSIYI